MTAKLLGSAAIYHKEAWLELPSGKTSALLYYLAYQDEWVSRDTLIYLFWPDTFENKARGNLRRLLSAIRDLEYTKGIEIETQQLRWLVDSDVKNFREALAGQHLAKAVQLYEGKLLAGFQPTNAPEFENWLELERQELHKTWKNAALSLASDFESNEQYRQAAEVLEQLHKTESFDETVFRRYLENLQRGQQEVKALEVFESFKKQLKQDFDGEPEPETIKLIQAIRQGEVMAKVSTVTATKARIQISPKTKPRHNLPVQATPFVGRESEKIKLAELLIDPACRLLSVVAPGGMGKTRLALAVASAQLEQFEHGVWFASFVPVNAPEQMIYTIADALSINFFGQREPKEQLFDYLAEKEMLLVLDNLEHLLSGIGLIRELLEAAPKIKILATSRERLNLQAENVFDLGGLAVPDEKNLDANKFDSLRLFAERAKHSRRDFALDKSTLPSAIHICKLVEGMPLAIELAANWLRVLSVSEIAREIEKGIGLLELTARDLPTRHQSIHAVFNYSWNLLDEHEQTILRRLSVFQGGFSREAAAEIAGTTLAVLANLVDKSFLRVTLHGRYSQQPLIYQYVRQKLSEHPEEKARTEEKHGRYYLHLVQDPDAVVEILAEEWPEAARERMRITKMEFANVRAAWHWAVEEGRVAELRGPLYYYLGQLREKLGLFSMTVKSLDETNPAHHDTLGIALIHQGDCEQHLGDYRKARFSIERGLTLLYTTDYVRGILVGLWALGFNAWLTGDYKQSKEIYEKGLRLARQHGIVQQIRVFMACLANVIKELDDVPNKEKFYEEGLEELRQLDGDFCNFEHFLHYYASFLLHKGDLQKAKTLARESLEFAERDGNTFFLPFILDGLGMITFRLGDLEQAQTLLQDAFLRGEEENMPFFRAYVLGNLGKVTTALGDYARAKAYLKESFEIGFSTKSLFNMAGSLVSFAELHMAQKQFKQAAEGLSLVLHHSGTQRHEKMEAKRLLEHLQHQLSPEEFTAALERGKTLDLTKVVQEILAGL